jgi:hypothetical protein
MFKVRMQGQYGAATDKRLSAVVAEMWRDWGFRKGIMRGYWVRFASLHFSFALELTGLGDGGTRNSGLRWVSDHVHSYE